MSHTQSTEFFLSLALNQITFALRENWSLGMCWNRFKFVTFVKRILASFKDAFCIEINQSTCKYSFRYSLIVLLKSLYWHNMVKFTYQYPTNFQINFKRKLDPDAFLPMMVF